MARPIVHIVHHIDTEGPLYEPVREVFQRLDFTLGLTLNIPPTIENLRKLQEGTYDVGSKELQETIKVIVDPHLVNFKSSWADIEEMLRRVLLPEFRSMFQDSFGGGWIYNWHIMDHVGFTTNKRHRDFGYLNIFDFYEHILWEMNCREDEMHWHFHPIPFFREAHMSATSYTNSYHELNQIICRRLIEKNWFPRVNRPGFHTTRPDSNWFLEQWIPFDASNQSINEEYALQVDATNGRFGDWTGAPADWSLYHPDLYDWRKEGKLNRYISRVLNMKTRLRNISVAEITKAFELARKTGEDVYLGIANHDFREMSVEIELFYKMLMEVIPKYSDIDYKFNGAIDAFRKVIGYQSEEVKDDCLDFDIHLHDNVLEVVRKNGEFFGPQPFLAIKTYDGSYFADNMDFSTFKENYFYTFDRITITLDKVQQFAVASNDRYGNTCICRYQGNRGAGSFSKTISRFAHVGAFLEETKLAMTL